MCGICGVFGAGDHAVVETMLETLRHRGPDDSHIISGDGFAIGARRLSIVDVAGGRQPLTNEDGTVTAAQNGELYNFPEARDALVRRGHHLATRTDTEILPHLWEEYGEALPQQIDGMFAVAVWDSRRQVGLLARDRMGKKPLYYWQHGEALYFASELKAILAIPGFARRLNLEALQQKEAPGETAARLRDSTAIVDTALEQVRSLSLTLRPSVLDDLGLAAALRWAVHREAARAGLEAELALAPGDTRMQPELETACFRIAQEALTNVVRHAQASRVRVALDRNDGELTLTVGDDGAGFDVAAARQRAVAGESLGLLGMEERALLLGGRLEIESASGAGTTVRARLPLAAGPVAEDTA